MKTRFALAAAASLFAISSASAADLGGNCCADLEERIAELEATTVRKGQRKVSLTVSGFVSHSIMWWDDGIRSDMYIADGGNYGSRFRFVGEAKIRADLKAGFLYEFGVANNYMGSVNQTNGGDDLGGVGVPGILRDQTIWLEHAKLGRVKLGHGSTATDNLILIDLGGTGGAGTSDFAVWGGGMFTRARGPGGLPLGGPGNVNPASNSGQTWVGLIRGHELFDTSRRNHFMYQTPTMFGFNVQTAVAEDNYWDVALRYAGEFNGVRIAFGIGYQEDTEFNAPIGAMDCTTVGIASPWAFSCNAKSKELKGSASILHVPTGLFLTGAFGDREVDSSLPTVLGSARATEDRDFWYLAGGIRRNYFGLGDTVIFADYAEATVQQRSIFPAVPFNSGKIVTEYWGVGLNQFIDNAAMQLFATYKSYSTNALTIGATGLAGRTKDFDAFIVGGIMYF